MEQRDLTRLARPKGNEEFFSTVTTINRADLSEVGLLASPIKSLPLPGEKQDHEEDEDLGLGKDIDVTSNADSERWGQGDGLEEQEFSIKEASFSEGSLKLKIQTTKRAKKPPKNLENYICPPEIRITIKQPGEQKTAKHARSVRGGKEEDKGPPRKRMVAKRKGQQVSWGIWGAWLKWDPTVAGDGREMCVTIAGLCLTLCGMLLYRDLSPTRSMHWKLETAITFAIILSPGNLALKSSVPVSNAMSTVASTIEARFGKQINVSKRGTIYIGKKRGRKPRIDLHTQQNEHKASDKHPLPISSPFENPLVPSNTSSTTGMPSPRVMHSLSSHSAAGGTAHLATTDTSQHDLKTMPNLQPISALPTKMHKGLLSSNWKLSPPRLMANSPSHLSEVASIKEVTLSPVSESHSEETIPSDSGIGTDNNSTSDQTEKGPASRRRYSFDLCSFDAAETAVLEAKSKAARGHYQKRVTGVAVENFFAQESLKKQKHRRKRKAPQNWDDLQFMADLEELVSKFQVFRISHRSYKFYHENSYPSIFRLNFDQYCPMPYYPYDPVHYLRRSSDKSKRRRGRPAKSNEPISKMPFIQGFGCPVPGGNYYAPYALPYTSMPLATSMVNMGYYGQYSSPLYLSHALGPSASPLMRPPVPPPKFHPGVSSSLAAPSRHRAKNIPHEMPSSRMSDSNHPSSSCMESVCLHKRKHKHKYKHKEDQYIPQREDLGGLFSGTQSPAFLNILNERLEKNTLSKLKDKQRGKQSTDALPKASRNYFEVDTLSSLSLSDSQHCKRIRGETLNNFLNICTRQPHERLRASQDQSLELFKGQHLGDDDSSIHIRRHGLEDFAAYREGSMASFQGGREQRTEQIYQYSNTAIADPSSYKRRHKHNEVDEIQCDMRKMCAFSKILTTKKNLDHVNKILKVKRLQRQAKTGNNMVKRRRGRPRKQPLSLEEGLLGQMPVLEKCVDLPGKKNLHTGLVPAQLEFSNHDSITDAIESVVHMARSHSNTQSTQGGKHWHKVQPELQIERPNRKGRGNKRVEATFTSH
ncbi:hypothetical protein cypCar_00001089 [Cyprinus carpio]|nr:hypothetical protein cypCar_00001089 [Cyprinus carpio]